MEEYEYNQKNMEKIIKESINYTNTKKRFVSFLKPQFVKCNFEAKQLILKFEITEWELNTQGSLHGGIIATCFDTTFGHLGKYFSNDNYIATITLTTNYLKPIWNEDIIEINSKISSLGKNIINFNGELISNNNKSICATSCASFMIIKNKKRP